MNYQPVVARNQPNPSAGITNSFNAAGPSDNAVSLNFEISGKYSFVDPSQYPDDPDMPALEDIVYSDDEEDVGVEADFSKLETNISVSPILTTKVHKDHHVSQIIGEFTLAPQTRSMARVVKEQGRLNQINDEDFHTYMFACFLSQEEPKRVHQALKDLIWIEAMQEEILQFKMQKVWVLVDLPKDNETEVHVSPSSSDKPKKHNEKAKREAKGKSHVDLSTGVKNLSDEFEDFSSNSTNRVNAASAPVTAEIWLRVQQMMKGSDIGIQEKKAKLFNEWERFTSNKGESIESYYHRFLKLMNDLKRNKHFPEKIASNLKFLNNLQPEWSRHKEVDELKAKRLAKIQDPLALMANSNNPYASPAPHQDQSPFNQNFLQQPMKNPEDITDPTTTMNMALALMAKEFKLNYSTPTNNN
nr:hypothetical protein [Tanacetum cinerariifolium]